jgi:hypothetical protein
MRRRDWKCKGKGRGWDARGFHERVLKEVDVVSTIRRIYQGFEGYICSPRAHTK